MTEAKHPMPPGMVDVRCERCGQAHFKGDCPMDPTYEDRHVVGRQAMSDILPALEKWLCDEIGEIAREMSGDQTDALFNLLDCRSCTLEEVQRKIAELRATPAEGRGE